MVRGFLYIDVRLSRTPNVNVKFCRVRIYSYIDVHCIASPYICHCRPCICVYSYMSDVIRLASFLCCLKCIVSAACFTSFFYEYSYSIEKIMAKNVELTRFIRIPQKIVNLFSKNACNRIRCHGILNSSKRTTSKQGAERIERKNVLKNLFKSD